MDKIRIASPLRPSARVIDIRRVAAPAIYDLRHRILRAGLPAESARFDGDLDPAAVHLAAFDGDSLIGCATVLLNTYNHEPACQLRGMAVDTSHQRIGVGKRLLEEVDRVAIEKGTALLWANARTPAAKFYEKLGWEIVSEQFEIPTAGPHFKMVHRIFAISQIERPKQ